MSEFNPYPRSDESRDGRGMPRGVKIALLVVAVVALIVVVVALAGGGHNPTQMNHG